MAEPKTKPTKVSAEKYIAALANEEQRNDAQRLKCVFTSGGWPTSI